MRGTATALWVVLSSLAAPRAAEACGGGGIVASQPGSIGANAQRVFLSVHATTTDVITQIGVPETTDDYGALLPIPSEPVLDPEPVPAEELEALDQLTAPVISRRDISSDSSGGCGCPMAAGSSDGKDVPLKGGSSNDAAVSQPVNIGPVTAVVLSGTTSAVNTWLADNDFAVSAESQATIEAYAGYYFIAIRRNEAAATGGATSIGVHFTMPGNHLELPLRFASLGAAPTVAFTLFIAANEIMGPSPPFAALTLTDLDATLLQEGDYADAVQDAVLQHDQRAFVLENSTSRQALAGSIGPTLEALMEPNAAFIRLSTILPAEALTEDAHFYTPFGGFVPNQRLVSSGHGLGSREAGIGTLVVLLAAGVRRRRPRVRESKG